MPKKQTKKKEFVCNFPDCVASFEQSNYLTNHKKFCQYNPENIKKMETLEDAKKELQELKTDPNTSPQEKEKINLLQQKEKEIAEKSQTRRDKKEDLDILKLDEQIEKHQEKSSGPDNIDKLLARRERVAIIKSLEQPPVQPQQNTQQFNRDIYDLKLEIKELSHKIDDKKTGKSDVKSEIKDSLDIAKTMGFSKSDETGTERMIGDTLTQLLPLGQKFLDMQKEEQQQTQQQPQPPEAPQSNPDDQIKELVSGGPGYLNAQPLGPDQIEIEGSIPQPQPISNPEPSDEELLNNPELRDDFYPAQLDSSYINQSLGLGKFNKFTATAPIK